MREGDSLFLFLPVSSLNPNISNSSIPTNILNLDQPLSSIDYSLFSSHLYKPCFPSCPQSPLPSPPLVTNFTFFFFSSPQIHINDILPNNSFSLSIISIYARLGWVSWLWIHSSWRGVAMDYGRGTLFSGVLILIEVVCVVKGNVVFEVHHKYGGSGKDKAPIGVLKAHDFQRHGRVLAGLDFQLGGDGSPTNDALYYTKITIGTPPVDYHVQVDTGSDILWVNCHKCDKCPTKSDLGISLRQYDMKASSTGQLITCDQEFCGTVFNSPNPNCKIGMNCEYAITYGDGSKTEGYFVRDNFRFDQVTGNLHTSAMNGSIVFGCSAKQSGELGSSSQAVDGIIGFGQANTSILSQLALTGKVKKIFSHCLDGKKGGGIFAVGDVVHPNVDKTPLVPNQAHYNVILKGVQVGDKHVDFPAGLFGTGSPRRAIIDSGTTLAYLSSDIYEQVLNKMIEKQPDMKIHMVEAEFKCFWYNGNVDEGFPVITFQFDNSISLPVYPHNYLFEVRDTEFCIGWQTSGMQAKDGQELTLLGDIALSDNLVVYDLENQTIGWAQYNCSSSIKLKDEGTGNTYDVIAHDISFVPSPLRANVMSALVFAAVVFTLIV